MANWSEMMRAPAREMLLGGSLVFGSGMECALSGDRVFSLTIEEGADGAITPGSVISAACTLELVNDAGQWLPGGELLGANELTGASLMPRLGIQSGGEILWQPLGVFVVESAAYLEKQGRLRLQASDSIASELSDPFVDGLVYPCSLSGVWRGILAQTRYQWSGTVPNGDAVIDSAPDWKNASLRTAMGYAAAAAGCFVCVNRSGALELKPVWNAAASAHGVNPESYLSLEREDAVYGPVDALRLTPAGAQEESVYYAGSDQSALHAVKISANPLFMAEAAHLDDLARGMLQTVAGYRSAGFRLEWRGDPLLCPGDRIALTDRNGEVHQGVLARQSLRFSGGFSANAVCALPREMNSGVRRAITPEGGLNAAALTGALDGAILSVGSITTGALAAGSITAEKIAAGTVEALSLEAVTAKLESLTAQDISTDRLAAAFAAFTVVTAASADFDQATVSHLVAQAMNLDFGTAGRVFIRNLAVEYAQMVSAAIGNLCIQASDGNYYILDVDENGCVTAELTQVSEGEAAAGQTGSGNLILETNITAANLNAGNLLATYALVNSIDAARIDVDELFAREAFITLLRTCKIVGEQSIEMLAGDVQQQAEEIEQNALYDSTQPPPLPIPEGKIWLDRSLDPPVLRRWLGVDVESADAEIYREAEGNPLSTGAGCAVSFERVESEFMPLQSGSGNPWPGGSGKNLVSPPESVIVGNASVAYDEGESAFTITKGGTSGAWGQVYYSLKADAAALAGKTLTLSFGDYEVSDGESEPRVFLLDHHLSTLISISPASGVKAASAVVPEGCSELVLLLRVDQGKQAASGTVFTVRRLQLEAGEAATDFAPWSNIRPIFGHSGASLRCCGKNLYSAGARSFTQRREVQLDVPLPPGTYTLSALITSSDTDSEKSSCGFVGGGENGENLYVALGRDVRSSGTVTLHRPVSALYLNASDDYAHGAGDTATWKGIQLECGSEKTAYESYSGGAWQVDFGATVYGGTMDWISGLMHVEWMKTVLDGGVNDYVAAYGASVVEAAAGYSYIVRMNHAEDTRDAPVICSGRVQTAYPSQTADRTADAFMVRERAEEDAEGSARYYFFSAKPTLEEFRAELAENPVELAFRLKTPFVLRVGAQSIRPVAGENRIYGNGETLHVDLVASGWETVNDASEIEQILGETALMAQSAQDTANSLSQQLQRRVRLDATGLHIGDSETENELLMQSALIHFVLDGRRVSTVASDAHRFGSMEIRTPHVGGIVIQATDA